ncbi:MAG: 2OG-Fe(II) oxygenase [Polyangiaceae bacterium]|nr:2OG-Fe(II) oxygenase [Polyangiaceae bacterium]
MPIDPTRWNLEALRERWRVASPFSHVVIDRFVDASFLASLRAAFDDEPASNLQDEIFDVMASSAPPEVDVFRALHAAMTAPVFLAALHAITGESLTGAEMRAYAYLPGHYLLPHADRDDGGRRRLAYAFYVDLFDGTTGGELDLYECLSKDGDIVETRVGTTIEPCANRCVIFEVSDQSLHRVREVTAGGRLSLAGWFVR